MSNDIKISVIVANYNHEKYIEQSVKSVLNQTYGNFEIIIVDDGSTDNSEEKIREISKLDNRIVEPLFLEKNMGKWYALNKAIEQRTTGQLITLNDADDASCPQRLERQLEVLLKTKSYHNLCGFKHCWKKEDVDTYSTYRADNPVQNKDIIPANEVTKMVYAGLKTPGINHYFIQNYEVHGATCLFYKQHWELGIRFLPGNLGLRVQKAEDGDFNTKYTLLMQNSSVLKEELYCYRRNTSTNDAWLENH